MQGQIIKCSSDKKNYIAKNGDKYCLYEVIGGKPKLVLTPKGKPLATSYLSLAEHLLADYTLYKFDFSNAKTIIPWHCTTVDNFAEKECWEVESIIDECFLKKQHDWTYNTKIGIFGEVIERTAQIRTWMFKCTQMQLAAICAIGNSFSSINIAFVLAYVMEQNKNYEEAKKRKFEQLAKIVADYGFFELDEVMAIFELFNFYYGIHLDEDGEVIGRLNDFDEEDDVAEYEDGDEEDDFDEEDDDTEYEDGDEEDEELGCGFDDLYLEACEHRMEMIREFFNYTIIDEDDDDSEYEDSEEDFEEDTEYDDSEEDGEDDDSEYDDDFDDEDENDEVDILGEIITGEILAGRNYYYYEDGKRVEKQPFSFKTFDLVELISDKCQSGYKEKIEENFDISLPIRDNCWVKKLVVIEDKKRTYYLIILKITNDSVTSVEVIKDKIIHYDYITSIFSGMEIPVSHSFKRIEKEDYPSKVTRELNLLAKKIHLPKDYRLVNALLPNVLLHNHEGQYFHFTYQQQSAYREAYMRMEIFSFQGKITHYKYTTYSQEEQETHISSSRIIKNKYEEIFEMLLAFYELALQLC